MVVKCQPRAKDVKIFVFKPSAAFQSVSEYSIATPVLPFRKIIEILDEWKARKLKKLIFFQFSNMRTGKFWE